MSTFTCMPENYYCHQCGAKNVKLWREYQTPANETELVCYLCAGKSQDKDVSGITDDGMIPCVIDKNSDGSDYIIWSDAIGWRVPAIPTNDGTFWGYSSVPNEALTWWRKLPNK